MNTRNNEIVEREAVFDALADILKAVANGRRLQLLDILAQGEHPVEALARMSGMAMTTTSNHLQTLHRVGLVEKRREKTSIIYRLSGDDVARLYLVAKSAALAHYPLLKEELNSYLSHADAPLVRTEELTPSTFIIDVRSAEDYAAGHFLGAVNIPMNELCKRLGEIPADSEVAIYCRGQLCRLAREAADLLRSQGINAKAMVDGMMEWRGGALDVLVA